jgi:hypothetical protein
MYGRLAFFVVLIALSALPAWAQGPSITLAWDPPLETGVAGYRVYVGTRSGLYSESYDVGNSTLFTYENATAGRRYYFAVAAYASGALEGPRSSSVNTVARATPTPPAARGVTRRAGTGVIRSTSRAGTTVASTTVAEDTGSGIVLQPPLISGSAVSLQWSPVGGLDVAEYAIEAGSASGLSNLYNASVGNFTSIRANVGDGAYFVRVRARLSDHSTATSNEVSFSIGAPGAALMTGGCTAPPSAPPFVDGFVEDGVATANWDDAPGATSYLVQAGTAPGLSNLFHGNVGASTSVSAPVPAGFTAYVRVVAVNACGQSVASTEIFVQ